MSLADFRLVVVSLSSLVFAFSGLAAEPEKQEQASLSRVGEQVEDFALKDFRGKTWSLRDFAKKDYMVVAFVGTECPLVKLYAERLQKLADKYADQGVALLAIDSNQQDSITELAHFARVHQLEFPLLKDSANRVADAFGARRTPEIFLLGPDRRVRYHGRIDDQYTYGIQRSQAQREDLRVALDELLAGKPVSVPETETVGCHIGRVLQANNDSEITYSQQISRILQRRCVECHRPGEIAPFSLTNYEETVGWAEMIAEVVRQRRMPPWHANPEHGSFVNDARLTNEERNLIFRWVDAGAPQGDPKQLPPPREFTPGWRIPQPDKIVYMSSKPFQVPAQGVVRYQYFTVDPGFEEDTWIQTAECLPGNRAVVHHIIVAVVTPDGRRSRAHGDLRSDWLAATAPGARPLSLPVGMAKLIPAGSRLVFQMHYTPIGEPQEDRSCIGLVFADPTTVKKRVVTQKAANTRFRIPPHAENYQVESNYVFRRDSVMLAMFPHMHLRGKAFRYTANYPDGKQEILLDVPQYDFNWQNSYTFPTPKSMPAGTRIHCVAHFDNSESNLANPDPDKAVRWGDQTWDEMMIGYFDMALTDQDLTKRPLRRADQFLLQAKQSPPQLDASLRKLGQQAFESPEAFQAWGLALRRSTPQLDRVCWITAEDDKLHIRQVAENPAPSTRPGTKLPAGGLRITQIIAGNEVQVLQKLAEAKEYDLRFMARLYGSSMHVPVEIGGRRGVLSFWSAEREAFPPAAVAWLTEATRAAQPQVD